MLRPSTRTSTVVDRGRYRSTNPVESCRSTGTGRRVAEADSQAGDARLDGDAAQVELGQVQAGGDRARRDVDPPGQGGVELDPPVVAAVAGQHPLLGGGPGGRARPGRRRWHSMLGRPGPRSSAAYRPGASGSIRSWPPPSSARSSARFAPAGTGWLAVAMTAGFGEDSAVPAGPTTATTSSRAPTARSEPRPVPVGLGPVPARCR